MGLTTSPRPGRESDDGVFSPPLCWWDATTYTLEEPGEGPTRGGPGVTKLSQAILPNGQGDVLQTVVERYRTRLEVNAHYVSEFKHKMYNSVS